nr:PREDICTED: phosphatidylinositol transfer protein PDR16-like isoform X2 [Daucus carota subsp. sativus]
MMKDAYKWQLEFKPEKIRWEDIAYEAETGKVYRADYFDRLGRSVVVMRPGYQNSTSNEGQIKYLVYSLEKAIMNMGSGQDQMVWLVDFQGYALSKLSLKVTKDTARILQNCYPERLGLAILYNPPKVFETFYAMVKPFLEQKTYKKVKFAYSNDPQSRKVMESIFDMDKLESAFGGKNTAGFDYKTYAQKMKEEDKKMSDLNSGCPHPSDMPVLLHGHSLPSIDGEFEAPEDDPQMLSHLDVINEINGAESESTKDVANVEIVAAENGHRKDAVAEGKNKKDTSIQGRT